MLFTCPLLVNNSLLPTRVFTSYRIKTVVFRMILICDVVFGLVYTGISPLKENGRRFSRAKGKADIIGRQYESVYTHVDVSSISEPVREPFPQMKELQISVEGVTKLLRKVNPNKASGPDSILARILKELPDEIFHNYAMTLGFRGLGYFLRPNFISQKVKFSSSIYLNACKYYVCGIKREMKVMLLHKIRVEKISLFHLQKCAVNYF